MGRLDGKVAFITGAARGQGRSHAIRLAQEGADIIAVDICSQLQSVGYPMATLADLEQTVKEVEGLGRRVVARKADVRDFDELRQVFDEGAGNSGRSRSWWQMRASDRAAWPPTSSSGTR